MAALCMVQLDLSTFWTPFTIMLYACVWVHSGLHQQSVCVQVTELPLALRRKKLALQYCLKLIANINNPAYNAVFNSKFKTQFDNKPSQTCPLGFRVEDDLQNLGSKKKNLRPTTVSTIPPWLLKRPNCNFSLCCYDKTTTNQEVFKRKFFELRSEFSHRVEIYTDGSKDGIRTAAAVVTPNSVKTVRLPDNASIFTAKIHALDMALDIICRTRSKDYVVFLDSPVYISCNRSLIVVSVRHWPAMTQSLSTVFELVIQDLQTLIS